MERNEKKLEQLSGPPVLIVVGPPCANKTQFLKLLDENIAVYSVCNVVQVFENIDTKVALSLWHHGQGTVSQNPVVYGIPLADRVIGLTDSEQMLLTMLFHQKITLSQLQQKLEQKSKNNTQMKDLFGILISCVEAILHTQCTDFDDGMDESIIFQSPTIDIYIAQAIPYASTKLINQLKLGMRENRSNLVVLNHCAVMTDRNLVKDILDSACALHRPVRFVRWGIELERVPFEELVMRNLQKYITTGRYIPIKSIYDHYIQAETLLQDGSLEYHSDFANWAGFQMDPSGFVFRNSANPNSPLRKSLQISQKAHAIMTVEENKYLQWTDDGVVTPIGETVLPLNQAKESAHEAARNIINKSLEVTNASSTKSAVSRSNIKENPSIVTHSQSKQVTNKATTTKSAGAKSKVQIEKDPEVLKYLKSQLKQLEVQRLHAKANVQVPAVVDQTNVSLPSSVVDGSQFIRSISLIQDRHRTPEKRTSNIPRKPVQLTYKDLQLSPQHSVQECKYSMSSQSSISGISVSVNDFPVQSLDDLLLQIQELHSINEVQSEQISELTSTLFMRDEELQRQTNELVIANERIAELVRDSEIAIKTHEVDISNLRDLLAAAEIKQSESEILLNAQGVKISELLASLRESESVPVQPAVEATEQISPIAPLSSSFGLGEVVPKLQKSLFEAQDSISSLQNEITTQVAKNNAMSKSLQAVTNEKVLLEQLKQQLEIEVQRLNELLQSEALSHEQNKPQQVNEIEALAAQVIAANSQFELVQQEKAELVSGYERQISDLQESLFEAQELISSGVTQCEEYRMQADNAASSIPVIELSLKNSQKANAELITNNELLTSSITELQTIETSLNAELITSVASHVQSNEKITQLTEMLNKAEQQLSDLFDSSTAELTASHVANEELKQDKYNLLLEFKKLQSSYEYLQGRMSDLQTAHSEEIATKHTELEHLRQCVLNQQVQSQSEYTSALQSMQDYCEARVVELTEQLHMETAKVAHFAMDHQEQVTLMEERSVRLTQLENELSITNAVEVALRNQLEASKHDMDLLCQAHSTERATLQADFSQRYDDLTAEKGSVFSELELTKSSLDVTSKSLLQEQSAHLADMTEQQLHSSSLQSKIEELNNLLAESVLNFAAAEKKHEDALNDLQSKHAKEVNESLTTIHDLTEQVQSKSDELEKRALQIKEMHSELDSFRASGESHAVERNGLEICVVELKQQLNDMTSEIFEEKMRYVSDIEAMASDLHTVKSNLAVVHLEHDKTLCAHTDQVCDLKTKIALLESEIQSQQSVLSLKTSELLTASEESVRINQQNDELSTEIATLRLQLSESKSSHNLQLEDKTQECIAAQTKAVEFSSLLNRLCQEIDVHMSSILPLLSVHGDDDEATSLSVLTEKIITQFKALIAEKQILTESLHECDAKLLNRNARVDMLTTELHTATNDLLIRTNENTDLQQKLSSISDQLFASQEEETTLRELIKHLHREQADFESGLADSATIGYELNIQVAEANETIERLRQEVLSVNVVCEELRQKAVEVSLLTDQAIVELQGELRKEKTVSSTLQTDNEVMSKNVVSLEKRLKHLSEEYFEVDLALKQSLTLAYQNCYELNQVSEDLAETHRIEIVALSESHASEEVVLNAKVSELCETSTKLLQELEFERTVNMTLKQQNIDDSLVSDRTIVELQIELLKEKSVFASLQSENEDLSKNVVSLEKRLKHLSVEYFEVDLALKQSLTLAYQNCYELNQVSEDLAETHKIEIAALSESHSAVQSELDTANGTISTLTQRLVKANEQRLTVENDLQTAYSDISALQEDLTLLQFDMASADENTMYMNNCMHTQAMEIEDKHVYIEKLHSELNLLREQLESAEKQVVSDEVVSSSKKCEVLSNLVSSLKAQLKSKVVTVVQLTSEAGVLRDQVLQLATSVNRLEEEKVQSEKAIATLTSELTSVQSNKAEADLTVTRNDELIIHLQHELSSTQQSVMSLTEQVDSLTCQIDDLAVEKWNLESQVTTLTDSLNEVNAEKSELCDEIERLQEEVEDVDSDTCVSDQLTTLEAQNEDMLMEISMLKAEIERIQDKLTDSEKQYTLSCEKLNVEMAKNSDFETQIQELSMEKSTLNAEIERLEERLNDALHSQAAIHKDYISENAVNELVEQIRVLGDQNSSLSMQNEKFLLEKRSFSTEIERLQDKLDNNRQRVLNADELSQQIATLKEQIRQLAAENEHLSLEVARLNEKIDEHSIRGDIPDNVSVLSEESVATVATLASQNSALTAQNKTLLNKNKELQNVKSRLSSEIGRLQEKLDDTVCTEDVDAIKLMVTRLTIQLNSLYNQNDSMKSDYESLRAIHSKCDKKLAVQSNLLSKLKAQVVMKDDTIAMITSTNERLNGELNAVIAARHEMTQKLTSLERDLAQKSDLLTAALVIDKQLHTDILDLQRQKLELQTKLVSTEDALKDMTIRFDKFNGDSDRESEKIEALEAKLEESERVISNFQKSTELLTNWLDSLSVENQSLGEQLADAQATILEFSTRIQQDTVLSQITVLKTERDELLNVKANLENELAKWTGMFEDSQGANPDDLRSELDRLSIELEDVTADRDRLRFEHKRVLAEFVETSIESALTSAFSPLSTPPSTTTSLPTTGNVSDQGLLTDLRIITQERDSLLATLDKNKKIFDQKSNIERKLISSLKEKQAETSDFLRDSDAKRTNLENRQVKLCAEIAELKCNLMEAQQRIVELSPENESDLSDLQSVELDKLQKSVLRQHNTIATLQADIVNLKSRLTESQSDNEKLIVLSERQNAQMNTQAQILISTENELNVRDNEISELRLQLNRTLSVTGTSASDDSSSNSTKVTQDSDSNVEDNDDFYAKYIRELKEQLNIKATQLIDTFETTNTLRTNCQNLENKYNILAKRFEIQSSVIDKIKLERSEIQSKSKQKRTISELKSDLQDSYDTISTLNIQLKDYEDRIKLFENEMSVCSSDRKRIYSEWSAQACIIFNKNKEISTLEAEILKLNSCVQNVIGDAKSRLENLEFQVDVSKSRSNSGLTSPCNNDNNSELILLQKKCDTFQNLLTSLKQKLAEADQTVLDQRSEFAISNLNLQNDMKRLQINSDEQIREINQLKQLLSQSEEKYKQSLKKCDVLARNIVTLKDEQLSLRNQALSNNSNVNSSPNSKTKTNDALLKQISIINSEMELKTLELNAKQAIIEELQNEISKLSRVRHGYVQCVQDTNDGTSEISQLRALNVQLAQETSKLSNELVNAQVALETEIRDHNDFKEKFKTQMLEVGRVIFELQTGNRDLQGALLTKNASLAESQNEINTYLKKLEIQSNLAQQIKVKHAKEVEKLQKDLYTAQQQVNELMSEMCEYVTCAENSNSKWKTLDSEKRELQSQLSTVKKELKEASTELSEMKTFNAKNSSELVQLTVKYAEAEELLLSKENEISALTVLSNHNCELIADKEREIAELQHSLSEITAEYAQHQALQQIQQQNTQLFEHFSQGSRSRIRAPSNAENESVSSLSTLSIVNQDMQELDLPQLQALLETAQNDNSELMLKYNLLKQQCLDNENQIEVLKFQKSEAVRLNNVQVTSMMSHVNHTAMYANSHAHQMHAKLEYAQRQLQSQCEKYEQLLREMESLKQQSEELDNESVDTVKISVSNLTVQASHHTHSSHSVASQLLVENLEAEIVSLQQQVETMTASSTEDRAVLDTLRLELSELLQLNNEQASDLRMVNESHGTLTKELQESHLQRDKVTIELQSAVHVIDTLLHEARESTTLIDTQSHELAVASERALIQSQEISKLTESKKNLRAEQTKTKKEVDTLTAELSKTKSLLDSVEQTLNDAKSRNKSLQVEILEANKTHDILTKSNEKVIQEAKTSKSVANSLHGQLQSLRVEMQQVKEDHNTLANSHIQEMKRFEDQTKLVEMLKSENTRLNDKLIDANDKLSALNAALLLAEKSRNNSDEKLIEYLNSELTAAKDGYDKAFAELLEVRDTIETLTTNLKIEKRIVDVKTTKIKELQSDITALTNQLNDVKFETFIAVGNVQKEVTELKASLAEKGSQLTSSECRGEFLQAELITNLQIISSLEQAVVDLREEMRVLSEQNQVFALLVDEASKPDESESLKEQLSLVNQQLHQSKIDLDKSKAALFSSNKTVASLRVELDSRHAQLMTAKGLITKLQTDLVTARQEKVRELEDMLSEKCLCEEGLLDLQSQIQSLTDDYNKQCDLFDAFKAKSDEQIMSLNVQVTELTEKLNEALSVSDEHILQLAISEETITDLNIELNNVQIDFTAASNLLKELQTKYDLLSESTQQKLHAQEVIFANSRESMVKDSLGVDSGTQTEFKISKYVDTELPVESEDGDSAKSVESQQSFLNSPLITGFLSIFSPPTSTTAVETGEKDVNKVLSHDSYFDETSTNTSNESLVKRNKALSLDINDDSTVREIYETSSAAVSSSKSTANKERRQITYHHLVVAEDGTESFAEINQVLSSSVSTSSSSTTLSEGHISTPQSISPDESASTESESSLLEEFGFGSVTPKASRTSTSTSITFEDSTTATTALNPNLIQTPRHSIKPVDRVLFSIEEENQDALSRTHSFVDHNAYHSVYNLETDLIDSPERANLLASSDEFVSLMHSAKKKIVKQSSAYVDYSVYETNTKDTPEISNLERMNEEFVRIQNKQTGQVMSKQQSAYVDYSNVYDESNEIEQINNEFQSMQSQNIISSGLIREESAFVCDYSIYNDNELNSANSSDIIHDITTETTKSTKSTEITEATQAINKQQSTYVDYDTTYADNSIHHSTMTFSNEMRNLQQRNNEFERTNLNVSVATNITVNDVKKDEIIECNPNNNTNKNNKRKSKGGRGRGRGRGVK